MGAFEDMLEDFESQAVFLGFQLEDWPALLHLTPEEKHDLFSEVETVLKRLDGPLQAINIVRDELHLVAELSQEHTIQESIDALEAVAERMAAGREEYKWLGDISVFSLSPTSVIDEVIRIHGASR